MIPILYSSDETEFTTNGLGSLSDAMSCIVIEERNGSYELEMEYPVGGQHYSDISLDKLIYAEPSDGTDPQPFSIYKITKPIDGIVTIYAQHISYRLSYIPVMPFKTNGARNALNGLIVNSVVDSDPFEVETDIEDGSSEYKQELPQTFRESLGGVEGSVLDIFGGEFEWDRFKVKLHSSRGQNSGVRIAYSKNLTDLKQEESNDDVATAIMPYWAGQTTNSTTGETETQIVTCPEDSRIIKVKSKGSYTYPYERVAMQDFSRFWSEAPTPEDLLKFASELISALDVSSNTINLEVSFVALWQTEEYKNIAPLERVHLCDTVIVEFNELGINAAVKVIATEYDVLAERYNKITLGESKSTLVSTVVKSTTTASSIKTSVMSSLKTTLLNQAKKLDGGLGGYVVIKRDANGNPVEIVIGNADTIEGMTKCIRINSAGIGFSDGYKGEMHIAMILEDGTINADYIGAGMLNGERIKAGSIDLSKISDGKNLEEIMEYVQIKPDGIYIGKSDSSIKLVQKYNKIAFVDTAQNDLELAYISNNRFYAPSITVSDNMIIGGYSISATNGLSFSWAGES